MRLAVAADEWDLITAPSAVQPVVLYPVLISWEDRTR